MRKWKQRIITAAIALVTAIPIGIIQEPTLIVEAADSKPPMSTEAPNSNYEEKATSGWISGSSLDAAWANQKSDTTYSGADYIKYETKTATCYHYYQFEIDGRVGPYGTVTLPADLSTDGRSYTYTAGGNNGGYMIWWFRVRAVSDFDGSLQNVICTQLGDSQNKRHTGIGLAPTKSMSEGWTGGDLEGKGNYIVGTPNGNVYLTDAWKGVYGLHGRGICGDGCNGGMYWGEHSASPYAGSHSTTYYKFTAYKLKKVNHNVQVRWQNDDESWGSYGLAKTDSVGIGTTHTYSYDGNSTHKPASLSHTVGTSDQTDYVSIYRRFFYVAFNSNKPSTASSTPQGSTATMKIPTEVNRNLTSNGFTLTGYTFAGWATSANGNVAYSNGQSIKNLAETDQTATLYAKWTPNDIKYKVEHYKEDMNGGYVLAETDNLTAKADSSVTPARRSYTGFDSPAAQTQSVGVIDNTLTIKYYYPRHIYNHKVYVRYQKVDGSWGPYALENSTNLKYEYVFNWSKAECQEYKGATISHATPAYDDTHYVDIERQKYDAKLIVYYQNVDGLGDADATFTPVVEVDMPQTFYGTTINWAWNPKTGFLTPVNAKRRDATPVPNYSFVLTGDTTIELWCFRELVTFDVNGAKLNQTSLNDPGTLTKFGTTDGMGVWNLYINSKLANTGKITDFYSTQMLWGSTWEIKNIDEAAGNHYYGADVN